LPSVDLRCCGAALRSRCARFDGARVRITDPAEVKTTSAEHLGNLLKQAGSGGLLV
jgi:hypothetical protein